MASTSETGHAKNVANFEDLISRCNGYGSAYNPSKATLQLAALTTLHTSGKTAVEKVSGHKIALINAINARQAAFDPLKKRCTRVLAALDSSDASDALIRDARTINNKIQGRRSNPVPKPNPSPAAETAELKTISVSQQSFDNLASHFSTFIQLVSSEASYSPNEADLTIPALEAYHATLVAANTATRNAYTDYSNSIIDRNLTLYSPSSGLVTIAFDVKKYVKSVFGASSPQYKQVSGIKFRRFV